MRRFFRILWRGLVAFVIVAYLGGVGTRLYAQIIGGGTATGKITLGSTALFIGQTYFTLTGVTFGWSNETWRTSSMTTDTLSSSDCGTAVRYTSNSAVTVTIPATLSNCAIKILQRGTAKVSVNGSAVPAATLTSPHGFTGTSGQGTEIGIDVDANPGGSAATAVLVGDGS